MASEVTTGEVAAEQSRVLYRQMPIALAVNLINATLTAGVLVPVVAATSLALWLGLVVTLTGLRYAVWRRYPCAGLAGAALHRWDSLAIIGSGLSGSLWGFGGALLFPEELPYRVFIGFTVGGMCAGAMVVHSSHFPTLLAFLVPACLPVAARFLLEGTLPDAALAGMLLVFTAALSLAGYNFNRSLAETFRLRSDRLRQMRALEAANARLAEETRERLAVQATLRQAEKMEALGQLTGGLAHDLNNLLLIILGSLDMLRTHVTGDQASRLLANAYGGGERAAKLTHSLLSFARRQSLNPELVDANRVIEDFAPLLRHAIGENATLTMALGPALASCRIDTTHFQTALLNLVLNAYDALSELGGAITIETGNCSLDAAAAAAHPPLRPGDYVSIAVRDTGTGMTPEVMARVFEPFYTTKEAGKGSGLGLSQVYGFVTQSGGAVNIESAPSLGTTVRLLLPAIDAPPRVEPIAPASAESDYARTATILVVEDDPGVRSVVTDELSELGYRVLSAEDGPTALARLQADEPVDLLFSDVVMPNGMRGDALARRAMELRPELRILLTSGYSPTVLDRSGKTAFPLLPKPFRRTELAEAIRRALAP